MTRTEHVQTKREIQALLAGAGLRPRRRFGQHFLIDGNLMRRLVEVAEIQPDDLVLEVGAGTGGLTDLLAQRAGGVVAVEIDRGLRGLLDTRFAHQPAVRLVAGDVLKSKHSLCDEVADALHRHAATHGARVLLVANLPYQVATPLVMNLLVDYPVVRRLCFTVQAEVGERILAASGEKSFGPLSVVSQALCEASLIARVPPQAFWPVPRVDSVMIRMDVCKSPFNSAAQAALFATFVRSVFDHRRKTLRSALRYVLEEPQREAFCERFDATRRPEDFSADEWIEMFGQLSATAAP